MWELCGIVELEENMFEVPFIGKRGREGVLLGLCSARTRNFAVWDQIWLDPTRFWGNPLRRISQIKMEGNTRHLGIFHSPNLNPVCVPVPWPRAGHVAPPPSYPP